eukprot:scaffold19628_cov28-Tisochrysis_lutea.AAC.1
MRGASIRKASPRFAAVAPASPMGAGTSSTTRDRRYENNFSSIWLYLASSLQWAQRGPVLPHPTWSDGECIKPLEQVRAMSRSLLRLSLNPAEQALPIAALRACAIGNALVGA